MQITPITTVLVTFALIVGAAPTLGAQTGAEAIRAARAAFNTAISQRDTAAIGRLLAPEYHIVTSRNEQSHGRAQEQHVWQDWFNSDPIARCQRETSHVEVNADWGQAHESGQWTCWFSVNGEAVEAAGVYSAKWLRAKNGAWQVLAEVFTATRCSGSETGCVAPKPPIAD